MTDKIVTQAINYMHSEPIGKVSVKLLVDKLGITKKTLINHFVSHLGITPYSYYKNLRINYAKKLINHGSTFEEAAESTGYSEAAALIRAMKQK